MKWIDLPPVWLALCALAVWLLRDVVPSVDTQPWLGFAGWALIGLGVVLMALAIWEMSRRRTTVIPHREASALVTSGIFGFSRNPIYLGDALALTGWTLVCGVPILLIFVPIFMWLIVSRFIGPEEYRLAASFGDEFDAYRARTRRWI